MSPLPALLCPVAAALPACGFAVCTWKCREASQQRNSNQDLVVLTSVGKYHTISTLF